MIRYRLACAKGHEFEGWFASSEAFDKQAKRKLVTCPHCGSAKVGKALMAPSVVTSERKRARRVPEPESAPAVPTPAAAAGPPPATDRQLVATGEQREMLQRLKRMRDEVLARSEYVGPRFAEEARRIHGKETAARGIHGEASLADVEALHEDGIEVYPVPVLPDDHN